jgi:hypothetical protein
MSATNPFWDKIISGIIDNMGLPEKIEIDEGELLQKAGERSSLPKKVKRLEQQLEQQSRELKELKDQLPQTGEASLPAPYHNS